MAGGGWGYGPFGSDAFGEWKWSKQVLFEFLPSEYKREDLANYDRVLETYAQGLRPSFDAPRQRIREYDTLRDPYKVRTGYDETTVIRLGKNIPVRGIIEQRGLDGKVESPTLYFVSKTTRFSSADIGKELTLVNATVGSNLQPVRISAIISTNAVTTNPALTPEAGPVRWELRAFTADVDYAIFEVQAGDISRTTPGWLLTDGSGVLELLSRRQLKGADSGARLLTEREGRDGTINTSGFFFSPSANFVQRDVGKKITVAESSTITNDDRFEIFKVFSPTTISTSYLQIRGSDSDGGVGYAARADVNGQTPRITHVIAGINTPFSIVVSDQLVTVNVQTDGAGAPQSTATNLVAAINADSIVSLFLFAMIDGPGTGIVGAKESQEVPGRLLQTDAGPLTWAVLPRAEIKTKTRGVVRGFVQKEGLDLAITISGPSSTVSVTSIRIDASDVGKILTIRGSVLGNDGSFEILAVTTFSIFQVASQLTIESGLYWEIREPTLKGDGTQVELAAPTLIPFLSKDFGIETDLQFSEARQRDAVAHITKWINKKGNSESYRILGILSGFNVGTEQLWRVSADLYAAIPGANTLIVGETAPGRTGLDGALTVGSPGRVRFYAATAVFTPSDVGNQLLISDADTPTNNKFYTIDIFLSAQIVEFLFADTATVPDVNNGTLTWTICRLYTNLPPLIPVFDDFNPDALEDYIDNRYGLNRFGVDRFCWEDGWITTMDTNVTAVQTTGAMSHTVTVDLDPFPIADILEIIPNPGTGESVGLFRFTDNAGTEYFMESFPVAFGFDAKFDVSALVPPVTGPGTIDYVCSQRDIGCGYCGASSIHVTIEADTILLESGVATQHMWERIFTQLDTEPKPAHVTLVATLKQTLQATLRLSASGLMDTLTAAASLSGSGTLTVNATLESFGAAELNGEGRLEASAIVTGP